VNVCDVSPCVSVERDSVGGRALPCPQQRRSEGNWHQELYGAHWAPYSNCRYKRPVIRDNAGSLRLYLPVIAFFVLCVGEELCRDGKYYILC